MNSQERFWKVGVWVVAILGIYLIALAIGQFRSIGYIGAGIQPTNTISVDGTGDAYAVPDIATFSFTVTDTEKAVADAQTSVTTKMNAALKAVTDLGVSQQDIQTTYYSIDPHYEYQNAVCPPSTTYESGALSGTVAPSPSVSSGVAAEPNIVVGTPIYCPPGKQTLTGYDVSESVSVKLRDITKAGTLLAALGTAGVSDLSGPSFDVDNPDAVQAQARAIAIADAQTKANQLAGQLGVRLVRIVSFTENNNGIYPQPVMFAAGAVASNSTAAAVPTVSTGQQKVTDDVTITYEIE